MPALVPTYTSPQEENNLPSYSLLNNLPSYSLLNLQIKKQIHLVKQIQAVLETEQRKLAFLLTDFHARNRKRRMQEIEDKTNPPPAYQDSLARIKKEESKAKKTRELFSTSIAMKEMSVVETQPW